MFKARSSGRTLEQPAPSHKDNITNSSSPKQASSPASSSSSSSNRSGRWSLMKGTSSKTKEMAKVPPSEVRSKTEIAQRLKNAVMNHPKKTGRSQDIIHVSRDFDRLRKNLREFVMIARKYQKAMVAMGTARIELYDKTKTLSKETHFAELAGSQSGDLARTAQTFREQVSKGAKTDGHAKKYQEMVIDYASEWESVTSKMVNEGIQHTHKLHKAVEHYEDKVAKLRKQIQDKESNDKSPSTSLTEKVQRNEGKLAQAWEDYDKAGTRTANLLEEATLMGWKDLHPLVQAMIVFEQERGRDEQNLLIYVESLQDGLMSIVTRCEDARALGQGACEETYPIEEEPTERTEVHVDDSSEEELPAAKEEEEPKPVEETPQEQEKVSV